MNEIEQTLINRARKQFKQIYPCSSKKGLKECFTVEDNQLILWFNTEDDSTHIIKQDTV
jgi:hypothetical protein